MSNLLFNPYELLAELRKDSHLKQITRFANNFQKTLQNNKSIEALEQELAEKWVENEEKYNHYEHLQNIWNYPSIWNHPSDRLLKLLPKSEIGIIQKGHVDWDFYCPQPCKDNECSYCSIWDSCYYNYCGNCHHHGFPCTNLVVYGDFDSSLDCRWDSGADYGFWRDNRPEAGDDSASEADVDDNSASISDVD